jgi:hypothetical protein
MDVCASLSVAISKLRVYGLNDVVIEVDGDADGYCADHPPPDVSALFSFDVEDVDIERPAATLGLVLIAYHNANNWNTAILTASSLQKINGRPLCGDRGILFWYDAATKKLSVSKVYQ